MRERGIKDESSDCDLKKEDVIIVWDDVAMGVAGLVDDSRSLVWELVSNIQVRMSRQSLNK